MVRFEDFVWLFNCDYNNRKIIRLDFDEASLLWESVKISNGRILELDIRYGGSTLILLGSSHHRQIYSLGTDDNVNIECKMIFVNYKERLHIINSNFKEYKPEYKFGLVVIDVDDMYEDIKLGMDNIWNYLEDDAYIFFHDVIPNIRGKLSNFVVTTHIEEIKRIYDKLLNNNMVTEIKRIGSSVLCKKITKI